MKKILIGLCALFSFFALASCDKEPAIKSYYIGDNGTLIAQYDDGTTKDLGTLADTIANGVEDIEINADGYYVINEIATDIKAKLPESYAIDTNGNLIVTYTDTTTENLGKFGNDSINTIDTISISDDGFYVLNGIKTDIVAVEVFDVTFETGYNEKVSKQTIKDGYKVERPEIERTGYTLNGWYCNGEEWRFNSDVVKNDMTLTADWSANEYVVSFDSNGATPIESITIKTGEILTLPTPELSLYTFDGWFEGNNQINSGEFAYAKNLNLVAKYHRTQYEIAFDSTGGNFINSMEVDSFSTINELPIPTRSEYEFLGWFIEDTKIELPYDFTEGNIELIAKWRGVSEDYEFEEDETGAGIKLLKYKGSQVDVIIPETLGGKTVTTIGTECFLNNDDIKSILFHSKVVNFEYKSVYNCRAVQEITISGDTNATLIYIFGSNDNIPATLTTVNFARGSLTYGGNIFKETINRTFKVNIFAELSITPKDAFYECNAVSEIYFYGSVKTFSSRTICSNYNLRYVNIPDTVTSIGMNNFINCPQLEYLIVPNSVKSVDYGGLAATDSILLIEAENKTWGSNAYTIYENEMNIFYGFEEITHNESFIYALCSVGSVKKAIILDYVDGVTSAEVPEMLAGYVVSFVAKKVN